MSIQSINPATGDVLETLEPTSPQQIQSILTGAHAAFLEWRTQPFAGRSALIHPAARDLRSRKDDYAFTIALARGKPIAQAQAQDDNCTGTLNYSPAHAHPIL